jgi:hypothetical protein
VTSQDRHKIRDEIATLNGYRPQPVPSDPEWAGRRLPEVTDEKAAQAALKLRGIKIA